MASTATTRRKTAAKPAPEPEVVEDEFEDMEDGEAEATEDEDLDELDEVDEAPAPKAKGKRSTAKATAAKAADAPKFGSAELAAYITEATGETYDARGVRMLLRKLAKDGKLNRVVGETRDRYSFSGPEDTTVQAVVTMIKDGTAKALKQAGLEKVKADAAAKKAAAKAKAEEEAEETDDMEDVEDEDVEEAPAPKPTRRRAAPAKAAPAKATATRRAAKA